MEGRYCWLSVNFCFLALCACSQQLSTSQDFFYKAAVVEYAPYYNVTVAPVKLIEQNVAAYKDIIAAAAEQGVDVIVFPEYGISTLAMPTHYERARPYLQRLLDSPHLCEEAQTRNESDYHAVREISCAAQKAGIYVVINLGVIAPCSDEPNCNTETDEFQYNMNVVFDRNGNIIAKYRKTHLFLEPQFNIPTLPDHVTFETDFGVQFGILTCFDIVYYEPSLHLYNQGTRHFVFPTAWVDELPFLTAIQIQEGWTTSLETYLLASGYHQPLGGQLGSGIYTPRGPIVYTYVPDSQTRMLIAEVSSNGTNSTSETRLMPKQESSALIDMDLEHLASGGTYHGSDHALLFEDLTIYASKVLALSSEGAASLCYEDHCCHLQYSLRENAAYEAVTYQLVAYKGVRQLAGGFYHFSIETCGLVACASSNVTSCAKVDSFSIKTLQFDSVSLSGNYTTMYVYPTAINDALQLFPNEALNFSKKKVNEKFGFAIQTGAVDSLLAIGLYGRHYELDQHEPK